MTIADLDNVCDNLVKMHSVYGVECLLNSLARACIKHPYLKDPEYLHKILSGSMIRALKEQEEHDGKL